MEESSILATTAVSLFRKGNIRFANNLIIAGEEIRTLTSLRTVDTSFADRTNLLRLPFRHIGKVPIKGHLSIIPLNPFMARW